MGPQAVGQRSRKSPKALGTASVSARGDTPSRAFVRFSLDPTHTPRPPSPPPVKLSDCQFFYEFSIFLFDAIWARYLTNFKQRQKLLVQPTPPLHIPTRHIF